MDIRTADVHTKGGGNRGRRRRTVLGLVSAVFVPAAGCVGAPGAADAAGSPTPPDESTTMEPEPTNHPTLASVLSRLIAADDRRAFAAEHDLQLHDGAVEVVIELEPDRELPADHPVEVSARHDRLVQGAVPVDDLRSLAEHPNVSSVRPPREPAQLDAVDQ